MAKLNIAFFFCGCSIFVLAGCGGKKTTIITPSRAPVVKTVDQCAGIPGENINITGDHFFEDFDAKVTLNGVDLNATMHNTSAVFAVPAGGMSGPLVVQNNSGSVVAANFTVLTGNPVDEIEPNDSVNGSDATLMNGEHVANGELSSATDRDHFKFDCLNILRPIRIQVSPRVVSVLYLDGLAVPLDADGVYITRVPTGNLLIGLTGATGTYNLSVYRTP